MRVFLKVRTSELKGRGRGRDKGKHSKTKIAQSLWHLNFLSIVARLEYLY